MSNRKSHDYEQLASVSFHARLGPWSSDLLLVLLLIVFARNTAAAPGDENWDDRFALPGGSGSPILIDGTNIYAAGGFTLTNGTQNIARWNGRSWSALGAGITNGSISALALNGNALYVGGRFTSAGGVPVNNIAKWDGTSWSALGTGITNAFGTPGSWVNSILADGGNIYVGGSFTSAGGVNATNIAKWDGASWSGLDTGLAAADQPGPWYVLALTMVGHDLYAGGEFATAGGIAATNIARWDGSSWHPVGPGVGERGFGSSDGVWALTAIGGRIYAGGSFATAGGVKVSNIAQWDGSSWSALAGGITAVDQVYTMAANGTDLYVGGNFTTAGGLPANGFAKWDGSNWSLVGTGIEPPGSHVFSIDASGPDVYVAGSFATAGGVTVKNLAKWDGATWSAVGGAGLDNAVNAIAIGPTNVYAGGLFSMGNGLNLTNLASWNGSRWSALGLGVNGIVRVLATQSTNLYVGGDFTQAGGLSAGHIAKWDGNNWSTLGSGVGLGIRTLAVSGADVYVGGFFTTAGGQNIANLAKWDGAGWSALGSGVSPTGVSGTVDAIATSGTDVYVGGGFTSAGGVPTPSGVAKWDGSSWSAVGAATDDNPGGVSALAVHGSDIYISGSFVRIGKVSANRIAEWNGSNWSPLGAGLSAPAASMQFIGNNLFVTGSFISAGGAPASYIAKWTGTNWVTLGAGLSGAGQILAVDGTDLYVGGAFSKAGIFPSSNFAIWHTPRPRASATFQSGGGLTLTWSSEPGASYQVLGTSDLSQNFTPLSGVIASQGTTSSYTDTSARAGARFYEIEQLP